MTTPYIPSTVLNSAFLQPFQFDTPTTDEPLSEATARQTIYLFLEDFPGSTTLAIFLATGIRRAAVDKILLSGRKSKALHRKPHTSAFHGDLSKHDYYLATPHVPATH